MKTKLTRRELQVTKLIAEGHPIKIVADMLGNISKRTVEDHLDNIYKKLKIHGIAELTYYALRVGFASLQKSERFRLSDLKDREFQIAMLIAQNEITKTIAQKIGLGIRAIESHRRRIFEKTGLKQNDISLRVFLIHFAVVQGFVKLVEIKGKIMATVVVDPKQRNEPEKHLLDCQAS